MEQKNDWTFKPLAEVRLQQDRSQRNTAWLDVLVPFLKDYQQRMLSNQAEPHDSKGGLYVNEKSGGVVLKYQVISKWGEDDSFALVPKLMGNLIVRGTNSTVLEGLVDSMHDNARLFREDPVWKEVTIQERDISFRNTRRQIGELKYFGDELFNRVEGWDSLVDNLEKIVAERKDQLISDIGGVTYDAIRSDVGEILFSTYELLSRWYHSQLFPKEERLLDDARDLQAKLSLVPLGKETFDILPVQNQLTRAISQSGRSIVLFGDNQLSTVAEILNTVRKGGYEGLAPTVWQAEIFANTKWVPDFRKRYNFKEDSTWWGTMGGDDGWYATFLGFLHEANERLKKEHPGVYERINNREEKSHAIDLDLETTTFEGTYEFPMFSSPTVFRDVETFYAESSRWFGKDAASNLTNPLNAAKRFWNQGVTNPEVYERLGSTVMKINRPYRARVSFTPQADRTLLVDLTLDVGNKYSKESSFDPLGVE